jgi:hypothetical protein
MATDVQRKIIDLEWPTRYVLECGHAIAIAPDASVADMAMPGQLLNCPSCGGTAPAAAPPSWLTPFKAGEAINALTLNTRLAQIEARLAEAGLSGELAPFGADEPINAETLNRRLAQIERRLSGS